MLVVLLWRVFWSFVSFDFVVGSVVGSVKFCRLNSLALLVLFSFQVVHFVECSIVWGCVVGLGFLPFCVALFCALLCVCLLLFLAESKSALSYIKKKKTFR